MTLRDVIIIIISTGTNSWAKVVLFRATQLVVSTELRHDDVAPVNPRWLFRQFV